MSPCSSDYIFRNLSCLACSLWGFWIVDLHPTLLSKAATTVHSGSPAKELSKACITEMLARSHRSHDRCKRLEFPVLCRTKRVLLEEGNDPLHQILSSAHHKDKRPIFPPVSPDIPASQPIANEAEYFRSVIVLADMKLGNQLKTGPTGCIVLNRDGKATFAIDKSSDVTIQPFLLIVRTLHIFTISNMRSL